MFGRMMVEPVVQVGPGVDLQTAIATLIKVAENVELVRWIELQASEIQHFLPCARTRRYQHAQNRRVPGTPV